MAKPASSALRAATANRLRDGVVVFRTVTGGWSWRHHRKWLRELARRQSSKPAE